MDGCSMSYKIGSEYHSTRTQLDYTFIIAMLDRSDRETLSRLIKEHPRSVIRMPSHDLMSEGYVTGYGGACPPNWDETIYKH